MYVHSFEDFQQTFLFIGCSTEDGIADFKLHYLYITHHFENL